MKRARSSPRSRTTLLFVVIAAALAGMTGCGDGTSDDASQPSSNGDLVGVGESLYLSTCASCHGTDLRGTELGPSHLSVVYEPSHHGDDAFRSAVANGSPQHHWGFGDMAPLEGLSASDVDAIIAFVRDTQAREGFEPYPPG